jgi:hypothetical protein
MKLKKNKVLFIPRDEEVSLSLSYPKPSKSYIPQWFKDMPIENSFMPGITRPKVHTKFTAKKCMPFIDSLTSGYTQELICDIFINPVDSNKSDTFIEYNWPSNLQFRPMSTRREESQVEDSMPKFLGYYDAEFHWNTFWEPKTPPGYSTFYFHPANRFDLPFMTHNGIIDTDNWSTTGPLPFVIKKGFSGIIPAGTPIYQMLFIKRDVWDSEASKYDEKYNKQSLFSIDKFFKDGYKKQFWSKKEYN